VYPPWSPMPCDRANDPCHVPPELWQHIPDQGSITMSASGLKAELHDLRTELKHARRTEHIAYLHTRIQTLIVLG
jgi:hypothetical protein